MRDYEGIIVEDDPFYYIEKVYCPIYLRFGGSNGTEVKLFTVWKFDDEVLETDYLVDPCLKKPFELEGVYWNGEKLDSCHYRIILNRYSLYLRFYRTTGEKIKNILLERKKSLNVYLQDKDGKEYNVINYKRKLIIERAIALPCALDRINSSSPIKKLKDSINIQLESIEFYEWLDFEETLDKKLYLLDLIGWE